MREGSVSPAIRVVLAVEDDSDDAALLARAFDRLEPSVRLEIVV